MNPTVTKNKTRLLRKKTPTPLQLGVCLLVGMASLPVLGNPVGGKVVAGAATIHSNGNLLQVNQSTDRAIINWQGFSINAGETTRFNLPNASSAVLNRVVTNSPSAIYGNISSNGQVFLINPNGIVVGPSGVINTSNLVLSTRNIADTDFMNRSLNFVGNADSKVQNLGKIEVSEGDAVLIGARAENAGNITASRGTVALVAGDEVLYAPEADARILVRAGVSPAASESGIDNSGTIRAAQAELRSTGGNPFALAINHTGLVEAMQVNETGGRVILSGGAGETRVSGTITAKAGNGGGEIQILGDKVKLASGALLDASGPQGGGTILVGGGYQGKNPAVQNAKQTTVEAGAVLKADATEQGDGGTVVVWSDGVTRYRGAISARGGDQGGDGGLAEVSGKQTLDFQGTVDLRAPQGNTGDLLLDPTDITIGSGLAADTATCNSGTCSGSGSSSYLDIGTLASLLQFADVTVTTASSGSGGGDITVDSTVAQAGKIEAPNSLTLDAERDILVNGGIYLIPSVPTGTGEPTLTLLAGRNLTIAPNLNNTTNIGGGTIITAPYALIGDQGLTLVAGRTDASGTLTIGANSNIGTISELSGGSESGGPIRVFSPSAAATTLTGWTGAASATVTDGKAYGNAGTAAAGIYYSGMTGPGPGTGTVSDPTPNTILLDLPVTSQEAVTTTNQSLSTRLNNLQRDKIRDLSSPQETPLIINQLAGSYGSTEMIDTMKDLITSVFNQLDAINAVNQAALDTRFLEDLSRSPSLPELDIGQLQELFQRTALGYTDFDSFVAAYQTARNDRLGGDLRPRPYTPYTSSDQVQNPATPLDSGANSNTPNSQNNAASPAPGSAVTGAMPGTGTPGSTVGAPPASSTLGDLGVGTLSPGATINEIKLAGPITPPSAPSEAEASTETPSPTTSPSGATGATTDNTIGSPGVVIGSVVTPNLPPLVNVQSTSSSTSDDDSDAPVSNPSGPNNFPGVNTVGTAPAIPVVFNMLLTDMTAPSPGLSQFISSLREIEQIPPAQRSPVQQAMYASTVPVMLDQLGKLAQEGIVRQQTKITSSANAMHGLAQQIRVLEQSNPDSPQLGLLRAQQSSLQAQITQAEQGLSLIRSAVTTLQGSSAPLGALSNLAAAYGLTDAMLVNYAAQAYADR